MLRHCTGVVTGACVQAWQRAEQLADNEGPGLTPSSEQDPIPCCPS